MFHPKALDWTAWSTLAVGFATSIALVILLDKGNLAVWLDRFSLSDNELNDLKLTLTTGILISVCVGWFYACMAWGARHTSAAVSSPLWAHGCFITDAAKQHA